MGITLVTGGAGFVGANLVDSLLRDGHTVVVLDSLARAGSEKNLKWLEEPGRPGTLHFVRGDVRDFAAVREASREVDAIYHLAAQVAVTTSVALPRHDFEINALGTLNVLEAARLSSRRPALVFTSTNKVYGECQSVPVVETPSRYTYRARPEGIDESQPLDLHSPYGCSKGCADQYVRDYTRIYGLPTVVFRMGCVYGPRQFGTEDQGWVAHFLIAAAFGRDVTIYGDGKQVRDILYIDDLVHALRLAVNNIGRTRGRIYNIGGGPENTLAVWSELGPILEKLRGQPIPVSYDDWRPGDQKVYVSDIRRAALEMGWTPTIDMETGLKRLWDWVIVNRELFPSPAASSMRPLQ